MQLWAWMEMPHGRAGMDAEKLMGHLNDAGSTVD
jgi:hypothetical protein